jgi:hypothetical protein
MVAGNRAGVLVYRRTEKMKERHIGVHEDGLCGARRVDKWNGVLLVCGCGCKRRCSCSTNSMIGKQDERFREICFFCDYRVIVGKSSVA